MTVIAYRYKTLVADTLGNDNGTILGHVNKIGRTHDGWLWGTTGRNSTQRSFVDWCESRIGTPPAFDGGHSDHILISPNGEVKWWVGDGWVEPLPKDFYAWGCGRELAMGAMAAGADAYRAVAIACEYDVACGHPVTGFSLIPDGDLKPIIDPLMEETEFPEVGEVEGVAEYIARVGEPISPRDQGDDTPFVRRGRAWRQKMGLE